MQVIPRLRPDEERCETIAKKMLKDNLTVRQVAEMFHISKSTVHTDITQRLKVYNTNLYHKMQEHLKNNKREGVVRGGLTTGRMLHQKKLEAMKASGKTK